MDSNDSKALKRANRQVTRAEKGSYAFYFVGQNIFYILISTYLNTYFLDVGISALAVTVLILVVKVWDAVNDPIFGGIVDRAKFRKGKFLPWLRVSLIAIPAATILLFAIPTSIPAGIQIAWAVIAYILWDTAYTICDVPIFGIITTMTSNQNERTTLMASGRIAALAAAIVVTVIVPQFRAAIGGWLPTAILLALLGLLFMIPICIAAKERVKPVVTEDEVTLKHMFSFIFKNKYMLILFSTLLVSQATAIGTALGLITARNLFSDEGKNSLMMIVTLLPTILLGAFIPKIIKKIDKARLFLWAMIAVAILSVATYFVGYQSFNLYLIMLALKGLPLGVTLMLMFMFTPDCAEYGTFTQGISASGIAFSMQTFTVKLTAALASSLGTFVLFLIGYISTEGATQPAGFADNLWLAINAIPAIGMVIATLIFSRYKLRDRDVQIMARANSGEMTREEANELLANRY